MWLVMDQGGREVVAACQPGFPDPGCQVGTSSQDLPGWGPGPSCLHVLLKPRTLSSGPPDTRGTRGDLSVPHSQLLLHLTGEAEAIGQEAKVSPGQPVVVLSWGWWDKIWPNRTPESSAC